MSEGGLGLHDNIPWLADVQLGEVRRIVDALHRVHHLLSAITDIDTLLERIMEESKQVAHAEACSLIMYDPKSDDLYFLVALGETGDQQALKHKIRLRLDQGIAGAAAATRQSINVPDVRLDERFFREADETIQFETRSLLAVPLVDRDTLIGVVEVVNKVGGGAFTETDLHVMEMFASLAATSITNARLIEENLRAERMAAIGQAVAGLSHYIKNIITAMSGSADLIDQALNRKDLNTEVLNNSWTILQRCTRRISSFVQDMLAFSKPRKPLHEACDIAALFEEAAEAFRGLLALKTIDLELCADQATGRCSLDHEGLFRCLLNLFMNAADAVPSQGGLIRATARLNQDGSLVIEVSDNGPGVPECDLDKIFDPFFSTKGTQGTGLGLAVTQKIVTEHGGAITADNRPEGGALFRITLPNVSGYNG